MNLSPRTALNLATGISALLLISNAALFLYQFRTYNALYAQDYHGTIDDDPHLQQLPGRFSAIAMTTTRNTHYSLIDDDAWAFILPENRGFVRLGHKGRAFELATYHQIHCINAIRFSYTVARDGLVTDTDELRGKYGHDNHCFQWIRQSINCQADSSLVPVPPPLSSSRNTSWSLGEAGFGITHRCRNWGQIKQFVEDNDAIWKDVPFLKNS